MCNLRKIYVLMVAIVGIFFISCNKDGVIVRESHGMHPVTEFSSPYSDRVIEYTPAPGQFINNSVFSGFTGDENTPEAATQYAQGRLDREGSFVSLGGFGGYIIVGFDHSVQNWGGYYGYDFSIEGNQFSGGSEPGIVWVMQDTNGNGIPDGIWYEFKGAAYDDPSTIRDYAVTYYRPGGDHESVRWTDNKGGEGYIEYIPVNDQKSYYPAWITADSYTLSGPCLADIGFTEDSGRYNTGDYGWGYADSWSKEDMIPGEGNRTFFKIDDAVNADGTPANLKYIDFVKVQTAVNVQGRGGVGELSTEVLSFRDENMSK